MLRTATILYLQRAHALLVLLIQRVTWNGVGGGGEGSSAGLLKSGECVSGGVYGICACAKGAPLSYHLDRIAPGVLSLCVPREASDPRLPVGIFVCLFVCNFTTDT